MTCIYHRFELSTWLDLPSQHTTKVVSCQGAVCVKYILPFANRPFSRGLASRSKKPIPMVVYQFCVSPQANARAQAEYWHLRIPLPTGQHSLYSARGAVCPTNNEGTRNSTPNNRPSIRRPAPRSFAPAMHRAIGYSKSACRQTIPQSKIAKETTPLGSKHGPSVRSQLR
jgi:hypothetical protein